MKYSILIILISFLSAGGIKSTCEEHLFNLYPENTDIRMHILNLDNQMKKEVENQVKQKFYRDKLYYWTISQDDTTIAYAFLDNVAFKMDYGTKTIQSDPDNPTTQVNLGLGYNFWLF